MLNFLACLLTVAARPVPSTVSWQINNQGGLVRDGALFNPIGLSVGSKLAKIDQAEALGVKNFCVHLSLQGEDWNSVVTKLQKSRAKFLIKIQSAAAPAFGYDIDPSGYRIAGIRTPTTLDFNMPGAKSALVIFATLRDGDLKFHRVVETPNGLLHIALNPRNDLNHVLLIYPLEQTMQLPDLWRGMDETRDHLLSQIFSLKNASGLAGIIDPLGEMPAGISPDSHFVPTGKLFQAQFAQYLRDFYKDPKFVASAWGMLMSDQTKFEQYARLVPLWQGSSGPKDLYDPKSGILIPVQAENSLFWRDLHSAINQIAQQRFHNITSVIHKVLNVPVLQTWNGWGVPYEGGNTEVDGLATSIDGTGHLSVIESASKAQSSISRWSKPGWLVVDNLKMKSVDPSHFQSAVQDLQSLNVQSLYLKPQNDAQFQTFCKWCSQSNMGQPAQINAIYYPDSVENPAFPQMVGGGRWWLPAPITGSRLTLGSNLNGYRMIDNNGPAEVIWANQPEANEVLLFANPKKVTIQSLASDFSTAKYVKGGIKLNIGSLPIVIRGTSQTPAPESAVAEIAKRFEAFRKLPAYSHADIESPDFAYREALRSLNRTPGPAFDKMQRAMNQLQSRLGSYYFMGAASPSKQNYGRSQPDQSSISGEVWQVKSLLQQPVGPFQLKYDLPYMLSNPVHIWIAISGTQDSVSKVTLVYNGAVLKPKLPGVIPYGYGYRWYDFGVTQMQYGHPRITVNIGNKNPVHLKFDSILIAPQGDIPIGPSFEIRNQSVSAAP